MRWIWLLVLVVACAPAAAAPAPTDDPRVASLQSERDALAAKVQMLQDSALRPTFVLWNTPLTIPARHQSALGLPDTFTVRIQFTATTPVQVRIMDFTQYVAYMNSGVTDALTYPASTNFDVTFHDAEGCGTYLAMFSAAEVSVITPNVTVTRIGPDRGRTGACAH